jgi:hypothetical protein
MISVDVCIILPIDDSSLLDNDLSGERKNGSFFMG